MTTAYIVVGEHGFCAVFLEVGRATEEAAKHHGIVDGLVRESVVKEMLLAAFEAGARSQRKETP